MHVVAADTCGGLERHSNMTAEVCLKVRVYHWKCTLTGTASYLSNDALLSSHTGSCTASVTLSLLPLLALGRLTGRVEVLSTSTISACCVTVCVSHLKSRLVKYDNAHALCLLASPCLLLHVPLMPIIGLLARQEGPDPLQDWRDSA